MDICRCIYFTCYVRRDNTSNTFRKSSERRMIRYALNFSELLQAQDIVVRVCLACMLHAGEDVHGFHKWGPKVKA